MLEKFIISRDDSIYEAWPDVALTKSGRLVCVFAECTHHGNRDYTRIMVADSSDRGRTWSPKRAITEPLRWTEDKQVWWNCPRITTLPDGRQVVVIDRLQGASEARGEQSNWLYFSKDEGQTWCEPVATPVVGIVPDQLIVLKHGTHKNRWLLAAHHRRQADGQDRWEERVWSSDDQGKTWQGPHLVAHDPALKLCEGSIAELPGGELVCFLRENSMAGLDAFKTISRDGGQTWGPLCHFPLPGCHRPVAQVLQSGNVLITFRLCQGGKGWTGWWTQNFMAALTDVNSCLAEERNQTHTRIMPIDFDRNPASDTGYSGFVQFEDGEIYVVNYIVDDAPNGHIRGYSFRECDMRLPSSQIS